MSKAANLTRRADLEAALQRAKANDVIALGGLADLWGTSKSNFTNTLRLIERMFEMPPYTAGPQGIHVYPAKKAIRVLLAYETRNDKQAQSLQVRTNAILGRNRTQRKTAAEEAMIPISDMAVASRVMAETEQRERDQGLYCSLDDMAATAANVFATISGFLSELEARIDPNGKLPAPIRALIKAEAKKVDLEIYAQMKDMLSGRAVPNETRPKGSRGAHGRARRASPRRKGR